ncbi:HAD family phosphatase [Enterococcus devriesei]|uniref:HAD family hydrolase n=1 Tax=Enterococcus devriesei TaxID=319970 RepID=UPI0028AB9726|nr:HAD family phosphatase [Enterococcus devriesei]
MQGIIFDFNGTMFLDSDLHEEAWINLIKKYSKQELSEADIIHSIHGKTNDIILRHFISADLTDEQVEQLSDEKEAYYRERVLAHPERIHFTKGLEAALDTLKANQIPMTIASASPKVNMDFYWETFALAKWFDPEKIVYHNGTFPGKPAPDIFLIAAKKIELAPADCLVIEDSYSGLQAAQRARIGTIVAIDPFGKNRGIFEAEGLAKDGVIEDFTNFISTYVK